MHNVSQCVYAAVPMACLRKLLDLHSNVLILPSGVSAVLKPVSYRCRFRRTLPCKGPLLTNNRNLSVGGVRLAIVTALHFSVEAVDGCFAFLRTGLSWVVS